SPWAAQTFGGAQVGDARNTHRLVLMATRIAQRPAGQVTQVFRTSAERQGADGLLENPAVSAAAVGTALYEATAAHAVARGLTSVVVALDGSRVRVTDPRGVKGTGRVGPGTAKARGF